MFYYAQNDCVSLMFSEISTFIKKNIFLLIDLGLIFLQVLLTIVLSLHCIYSFLMYTYYSNIALTDQHNNKTTWENKTTLSTRNATSPFLPLLHCFMFFFLFDLNHQTTSLKSPIFTPPKGGLITKVPLYNLLYAVHFFSTASFTNICSLHNIIFNL